MILKNCWTLVQVLMSPLTQYAPHGRGRCVRRQDSHHVSRQLNVLWQLSLPKEDGRRGLLPHRGSHGKPS